MSGKKKKFAWQQANWELSGVAYVLMSSVVQPSDLFGGTHEPV